MTNETKSPSRVLLSAQAAERLGLSPKTLKRWRSEGTGPAFVVLSARRVGYYENVLDAWLAAREARNAIEAHAVRKRLAADARDDRGAA